MGSQIFISYRRNGGDVAAKLICEALKNRGYTVFYDYDSLKGGTFDNRILEAVEQCNDVVLVLPKRALHRCRHKNDWVRQEIRHALALKKNIIPIMMDKFEFPKKLPQDIQDVTKYNGVRFQMDFFDTVVDKIAERLVSPAPQGNANGQNPPYQANTAPVQAPAPGITKNIQCRLYLHLTEGFSSDLVLYSLDSSAGNIAKYDFLEQEWNAFVRMIKSLVACIFKTSENRVSVSRKSNLGLISCAPMGELTFDDAYRIKFNVNYLTDHTPLHYDSLHLQIENGMVKISLYDQGNYVFQKVSAQTKLSYFDIDEQALITAIQPLVAFAERTEQIGFAACFDCKVYSDKSGGYYLKYLTE